MHIVESKKFSHWLNRLKDDSAVHQIQSWAYRMARSQELLGDWKRIGPELIEFRFFTGSGYRVYASVQNGTVLILLGGGNKSTQTRDIKKAEKLLREWKAIR